MPPDPLPDDPRACAPQALPPPYFSAEPERPCTEEHSNGTTAAYRYDATGRVVYRAVHTNYGYDATYTSEDDGGIRIEALVENGRTSTRDVTWLSDGKPVEADHFKAASDGGLVLHGHSTWLYDANGRQQYVITQLAGDTRKVERHVYDSKGRQYFVDLIAHWPGATTVFHPRFTYRSWYANGTLAREVRSCGETGGRPCDTLEQRWEPCGNLAYSGHQTGNWRHSGFTDWSWDQSGRPLAMHVRWNTTGAFFNTTETYHLDDAGRAISGTSVTVEPPGYAPVPPRDVSYTYDDAGHLIEASGDGRIDFQARYDSAGRLVARTRGGTTRWTYDGCGR